MAAYTQFAPTGFAGDIAMPDEAVVEAVFLDSISGTFAQAWGIPLKAKTTSGETKFVQVESGDAATVFKGFLVRQVPTVSGNANFGLNNTTPNPNQVQGMLTRGYICVACTIGTPVRGGIVYMRVTAASGKLVGDIEATADGANNVALTNVEWATDGKDAGGIGVVRVWR